MLSTSGFVDDVMFSYDGLNVASGVSLPQQSHRSVADRLTPLLRGIGCVLTYRVVQKSDPLVYFDDNFGKYGPI